jgi:hypothetical protein
MWEARGRARMKSTEGCPVEDSSLFAYKELFRTRLFPRAECSARIIQDQFSAASEVVCLSLLPLTEKEREPGSPPTTHV